MQGKSPVATCPYCGSREFWPSRKRLPESLLGPLLPYRPFRCRTCLKRYVRFKTWLAPILAVILLAGIGGAAFLYFGPFTLGERFFAERAAPDRPASEVQASASAVAEAAPGATPHEAAPGPLTPAPEAAAREIPVSQRPATAFTRLHLNIPPAAGERP